MRDRLEKWNRWRARRKVKALEEQGEELLERMEQVIASLAEYAAKSSKEADGCH